LLAVPVPPRLGALAVTIYACGLAGVLLGLGRSPQTNAGTVNPAGQRDLRSRSAQFLVAMK
jgi:hypothetical protein